MTLNAHETAAAQATATRLADRASRSQERTTADRSTKASGSAAPATPATPPAAKAAAPAPAAASHPAAPAPASPAPAAAAVPAPVVPAVPTPVAGLTQAQMNNAQQIVAAGKALGLPKRAYVLAVACAMQESNLLNLASSALPESYSYPNEGTGSDHDSVGLFQQRPSAGWGSVQELMTPDYAAKAFYRALIQIPGWDTMALTNAIQAVQVSAFPDAYAQHEGTAQAVVDALT